MKETGAARKEEETQRGASRRWVSDVDRRGKICHKQEAEARTVRIIFEMYSLGKSYGEIINTLNSHGYKTKSGRDLAKTALHDILCNKALHGLYISLTRIAAKKDGRRNHHLSKPQEEIIEIPDAIPPIIDKETFARVEERMNRNRTGPARSKAKVNYLLSGSYLVGNAATG